MQYPEFEDPFNLPEDTIKNIIEDPNGNQRIQAYMHSLSDQLFKTALSSIKQLNQEWAFPHQEIPTSQNITPVTQEMQVTQAPPLSIEKKDIKQPQETFSSPQVSHRLSQDIPKKTPPPYKQESEMSLNSGLILSESIPEGTQPHLTPDLDLQPIAPPIPEIQTETIEKETSEKNPVKAKVDSEALENRYKKRQKNLQDFLKKKGNIS